MSHMGGYLGYVPSLMVRDRLGPCESWGAGVPRWGTGTGLVPSREDVVWLRGRGIEGISASAFMAFIELRNKDRMRSLLAIIR